MKALGVVLWVLVGIAQFVASIQGLGYWLDWPAWVCVAISMFLGWIPFLGGILAAIGAHYVWEWSWPAAIALFYGIPLVFIVIGGAQSMAEMFGRRRPSL